MVFDIAPEILDQIEEYARFHGITFTDGQKEEITKKAGEHALRVLQGTGIVEYYMESIGE